MANSSILFAVEKSEKRIHRVLLFFYRVHFNNNLLWYIYHSSLIYQRPKFQQIIGCKIEGFKDCNGDGQVQRIIWHEYHRENDEYPHIPFTQRYETSLSEIVAVIFVVINGSVGPRGWICYMSPNAFKWALNVLSRVHSQRYITQQTLI